MFVVGVFLSKEGCFCAILNKMKMTSFAPEKKNWVWGVWEQISVHTKTHTGKLKLCSVDCNNFKTYVHER